MQNHREVVTFEDFASQVFSPSPGYPMSGTGEKEIAPHHSLAAASLHLSVPLFRPSSAHPIFCKPFLHFLHICRSHLPLPHPSLPTFADEYQTRAVRLSPPSERLQTLRCLHFFKASLTLSCCLFLFQTTPLSVQLLSL